MLLQIFVATFWNSNVYQVTNPAIAGSRLMDMLPRIENDGICRLYGIVSGFSGVGITAAGKIQSNDGCSVTIHSLTGVRSVGTQCAMETSTIESVNNQIAFRHGVADRQNGHNGRKQSIVFLGIGGDRDTFDKDNRDREILLCE